MKKAIAILLTALLLLTVFVSCEGDVEDMFGKTVSFNGNGSTSGQMAEMKVKKGEEVTLPANEFTRTDYVFAGWNTQADGSGTGYADKAKASFDDNTVLYAQWAEELTITFNANDGSGTMNPVKVSADVYELPENGFTAPEGYAFVRWSETAAGEVEYEVGDELEVTDDVTLYAIWAQVLSTTPDDLLNGRYTITENTPIDNRFGASGTLKLYLLDGKTLNAKKGITVTDGNTLVIDKVGTNGNGKLIAAATADDEWNKSGIGGDGNNIDAGTIIINGGTVTATGGQSAAGIGGGYHGNGGTVAINGGIVTAIGGFLGNYGGAGIGGGADEGNGGTVTINGGTVTANGGNLAAGIGGGWYGTGGTVTINGGTVEAIGGSSGAGIGGGFNGKGGTVAINGGTVTATGGSGAEDYGPGIGAGGGSSSHGKLTIGYAEIQANSLVIKSGWSLYYGNSENPTVHVDGLHNANDISDYVGRYMNVTQPST